MEFILVFKNTDMPMLYTQTGKQIWYPEESKPPTCGGTKQTQEQKIQIRQDKTIEATARAMTFGLSEEEMNEVIQRNAQCVEMDPSELESLAKGYLEYMENERNSIERE
jgi:hypothetical protein